MIAQFNLTEPPSANRRLTTDFRLTPQYRAWKKAAGWEVLLLKQPKIKGHYRLTLYLSEHSRLDLDNGIKAISDLMQGQGIIENDRLARSILLEYDASLAKGRCSVFISPVSDPLARAA